MSSGWRCHCGARNAPKQQECEGCGAERKPGRAKPLREHCWIDGSPLNLIGFCEEGNGYPLNSPCPFACPVCRRPLSWSGACLACFGCTTGRREEWTMPGDRYEVVEGASGSHWVKVESGPRGVCTVEENAANLAKIKSLFATAPMMQKVK